MSAGGKPGGVAERTREEVQTSDAQCARAEKEQERADRTEREREHLAAQLQALDDERQDELMVADNDFEMVEVQQELQVRTAPPCPARPCSLQHHCP